MWASGLRPSPADHCGSALPLFMPFQGDRPSGSGYYVLFVQGPNARAGREALSDLDHDREPRRLAVHDQVLEQVRVASGPCLG